MLHFRIIIRLTASVLQRVSALLLIKFVIHTKVTKMHSQGSAYLI